MQPSAKAVKAELAFVVDAADAAQKGHFSAKRTQQGPPAVKQELVKPEELMQQRFSIQELG